MNDGLPSDNITAVAEDSSGYMYIGTAMGLSFFDGINFTSKAVNAAGDVPGNVFVERMVFDKNDNLWMSTEHDGLFFWNRTSNQWVNFSQGSTKYNIPNNTIWDIEIIENNLIVSFEDNGLHFIDVNTLKRSKYSHFENETVCDISKESKRSFLLTTKRAVYRLDSSLTATSIDTLYSSSSPLELVESYTLSDETTYTVGYTNGLFKINNGNIVKVNQPAGLDTWRYNFISEHDDKQWLTLRNHGLASIDLKNHEWKLYESQPYSRNTLPKGKYHTGYLDSRGILWVATSKGLSSIDSDLQAFTNITNPVSTNEFLLESHFDNKRQQYVMLYASEQDKVKFFDTKFRQIGAGNHTPDKSYIQSLRSLIPFGKDYICLGHQIMHIDGNTGSVTKAKIPGLEPLIKPTAIAVDTKDNLWIVYDGAKLLKYSMQDKKIIKQLPLSQFEKSNKHSSRISTIANCDKYMCILNKEIFLLLDKATMECFAFDVNQATGRIDKIEKKHTSTGSITQMMEYEGSFYICTRDEGIYKAELSPSTMEFTVTASIPSYALPAPVELGIDTADQIWIATDHGLVLADIDLNIKKVIAGQSGLLKTKLSEGLSITNDKIILTSENGIVIADPDLLAKTTKIAPVEIRNIWTNNQLRNQQNEGLSFSHDENYVRIDVSMPVYQHAKDYQYEYRLRPLAEEWATVKASQSSFRYDNLQPELYTFEIRAVHEGRKGKATQVEFEINPPFWKTWWFVLLAFLSALSLATWMYKSRVRAQVNQEKIKTKLAELQNEAIRAQLNPHFIFNALNSIRSLILMDKKEGSLNYLGRFSNLVREVLSISKEQSIPLARELAFNENYVNIERLRFNQSLTYQVTVQEGIDVEQVKVPSLVMQPFIENAIWHGLLGKNENARLKVNIATEDDYLLIHIDDNGSGRTKHEKKQPKSHKTKKAYGELLSRQRLQSMGDGASINIIDKTENAQPTGTTVVIKLPLNL